MYLNDVFVPLLATINVQGPGLFEPIHGSAPDIAGQVEFLIVQFSFLW